MTTSVISNYLENALINHILRNSAYASPGTDIYVALFTNNPGEDGSGDEVSGGSYAREQVTAWDAPASRATQNTSQIDFTTATGSWGEVTHIGIFDAETEGNLLFYGELDASKTVGNGDTFSIAAGDIDISLTGNISNYLANALLSHVLRNTAYASPGTSIYAALYTDDPTVADVGTEVSGGSYARKQITTWDAPANGVTANTSDEAHVQATGSWGEVTHGGIRDADSGGNLLFFGALTASKTVESGDTFQWSAGNIDITIA